MVIKRSKSQARRHTTGLPGWSWMIIGIVLTIIVVLSAPEFLSNDNQGRFFLPVVGSGKNTVQNNDHPTLVTESAGDDAQQDRSQPTQYEFYTMLSSTEELMSDVEIAAIARQESHSNVAQDIAHDDGVNMPGTAASLPANGAEQLLPYILQAGSFATAADAEVVKVRIALLGLRARVESAQVQEKVFYRVRMGPYRTALALTQAKQKLANNGLPALAIKTH